MQTPSTLSIWLSEQLRPLLLIASVLALVSICVYLSMRMRHARIKQRRLGMTEDSFVHSLVIYGFDPLILRTAFHYLQATQQVAFPIQASDLLDEDLGLGLDELEETVRDLFRLTERVYQPGRRDSPLLTVEDLVRFVQASPRRSRLAA